MKYIYKLFLIFLCIIDSFFLLSLVNSTFTISKVSSILFFLYFNALGALAILFESRYIKERLSLNVRKKLVILSAIVAILFVVGFKEAISTQVIPTFVTITATGEKNSSSAASEVWVKATVSGELYDLSHIKGSQKWVEKDGYLVSTKDQPASITLEFGASREIRLSFVSHAWSGKVTIEDGNKTKELDLYSANNTNYTYNVLSNVGKVTGNEAFIKFTLYYFFIFTLAYLFICLIKINTKLLNLLDTKGSKK